MHKKLILTLIIPSLYIVSIFAMHGHRTPEQIERAQEQYQKWQASRKFISSVADVPYRWERYGVFGIRGESESGRLIYIRQAWNGYQGEYYPVAQGSARPLTPELARELAIKSGLFE